MTQITKDISEEYVVATDLDSYSDLIETSYKYRLLKETLINSLEYDKWSRNKVRIDTDKVVSILNAMESVAYSSVVKQLISQYEAPEEEPVEEIETLEE